MRSRHLIVVLVAAALVVAGCGDDNDRGEELSTGRYGPVYDALCEATGAADAGDAAEAERVFFDRVHQPLHELAPAVAARDRATAARLLEAKEAAEAALDADDSAADALTVLTMATRAALAAIDHPAPRPCPEGN